MDGARPPRVLLVGLDRYGMRACVRLGLDTVVVCGGPSWDAGVVAVPDGVRVLRVDEHSSPEAVLMALHRAGLGERGAFDAVYTSDEWSLVMVSLLARHFGVRGLSPRTAVRFRDKTLQKQVVRDAGVAAARTMLIEDIHDLSGASAVREPAFWRDLGRGFGRAVLKPVAGAATARTSIVTSADDLVARARDYREQRTAQRTFVLEEYVGGEEWIADGVVYDGELLFCAVGRYGDPCLTALGEGRPLTLRHFDPDAEAWAYRRALPVVAAALKALGLRDAPFHMELFHDPDTEAVTFSECAARRGGALIHEQVLVKFRVDLAEASVLAALGRRPDIRPAIRAGAVGSTYLTDPGGRSGILLGCPSAAELAALPCVEYARIERPVGARLAPGLASTNQRIGQCLVVADTVPRLAERLDTVRDWFAARLRILPDGLTPRQLRDLAYGSGPGGAAEDAHWR
ncbi:MAG TPA: hypothetical protein VF069_05125 [Streptosporangiaceae bacterium]